MNEVIVKIKKEVKKEYKRFFIVVIASILYSLGLIWFLKPAGIFSGGVVGLMQLITDTIELFTGKDYSIGIFIFIANVPLLIIAFRKVSLKFSFYTLLSIIIQTITGINGLVPVLDFGVNQVGSLDPLLLAIIGGGLVGVGGALALRYGGSTGGIDIIAQVIALKHNFTIGKFSLIFNCSIAIIGGIILKNPALILYTVVRIFVTSIVTDRIHTIYNRIKIEIITDNGEEIAQAIMKELHRGVTLVHAEGCYTHSKKYILEVVVSSFQFYTVHEIAKRYDEKPFIFATSIKSIYGNFKKHTLV